MRINPDQPLKLGLIVRQFTRFSTVGFVSLLVLLSLGQGCSDPPNYTLKSQLTLQANAADRFTIAATGEYADSTFKKVEMIGPTKVSQFLAALEFSSKPRFRHGSFRGEYQIEFLAKDQRLVTLSFTRGNMLSWKGPGDAQRAGILTRESSKFALAWLATNGCDIVQRENDAERATMERRRKAEQECVACFPPEVRNLFSAPGYGVEVQPWAAERGEKLAKAINNPIKLTAMACRGFGFLDEYWGMNEFHERILRAAISSATGRDFGSALAEIAGDRRALLGAGRIFFGEGYVDKGYSEKLSLEGKDLWAAQIGEVVANDGNEENFPKMCLVLADIPGPRVNGFLRRIARGETGKAYVPRGLLRTEPTLAPAAYLCLALQGDAEMQPEIARALTATDGVANRAALEVALAALDPVTPIRKEHFMVQSWFLGYTGLKVVEKFPTRENVDALVSGGFHHPWAIVSNEAFSLFERITHHPWPPVSRYNGNIERWWDQHREEFGTGGVRPNKAEQ